MAGRCYTFWEGVILHIEFSNWELMVAIKHFQESTHRTISVLLLTPIVNTDQLRKMSCQLGSSIESVRQSELLTTFLMATREAGLLVTQANGKYSIGAQFGCLTEILANG